MSITLSDVANMDVNRIMADFYVLERLVADGSRKARLAQIKLEAYAAPRLMRYLSDICGGEMRHVGGNVDGCGGSECSGMDSQYELGECMCCSEDQDAHVLRCTICGASEWDGCEQRPCDCDDEDCQGECNMHDADYDVDCYCYCPYDGPCPACEEASECILPDGLPGKLEWFLDSTDRGSRSDSWDTWHDFHDKHGNIVLKWLVRGFNYVPWTDGYGGEAWGTIAAFAKMYAYGEMSAHAFMDRCWTLQHNGGNVFDKMHDDRKLNVLLMQQADDDYGSLVRAASPDVRGLWAIRPYVLAEALDRDPVWLGTSIPQEVEW